jgi:CVNH domain
MKTVLGAFAAVLLAGTMCTQPAHAQPAPQGSYLNSCTHVGMDGGRLIADCRRADGGWHRTVLDINRCVGDIGNMNGQLNCNRGPGAGYGASRRGDWREGYGSSRRDEWRDEQRARCSQILDPFERDRCWSGR